MDRVMVGFRQNNIFNRWLARWEKDIVTKEHIGCVVERSHGFHRFHKCCAKKGLTQRRGDKEAERGFSNLNLG